MQMSGPDRHGVTIDAEEGKPVKINLSWDSIRELAELIATKIIGTFGQYQNINAYPIPRGGVYAALAVQEAVSRLTKFHKLHIVDNPNRANCYIDDIIDSGKTCQTVLERWGRIPFYALINKLESGSPAFTPEGKSIPSSDCILNCDVVPTWYSFPWERMSNDEGPVENVTRLIQYIGDDPTREGLQKTPERVVKSFKEIYAGYNVDVGSLFTTFGDDVGSCDEMIISDGIQIYSVCEHHMQPFFGTAHIGYIPSKRVVGVSKLTRVAEAFARRLQIQERLTKQITDALDKYLEPQGSACVIRAKHFCMMCRGVNQPNSVMVTNSLTGAFRTNSAARAEFFAMISK